MGGGSSGDSGGGGGSVDLTETNNLISGVAATIRSGDEKIVNTIKSGDNAIISAIRSGDAAIIGFIGDDSDIDNMLDDLCSSGDTIQSLANDWGFTAFANPWATLIYEFFDAILSTLQIRENVSWGFNFGGQTFFVNSADFDMLPRPLKTFVSGYLIFACIFVLYNSLRKTIDLLSTANTKEVLNTVEVDMNYIKM